MELSYTSLINSTLHAKAKEADHEALAKVKDFVAKFRKKTVSCRINHNTVVCLPASQVERLREYQDKYKY